MIQLYYKKNAITSSAAQAQAQTENVDLESIKPPDLSQQRAFNISAFLAKGNAFFSDKLGWTLITVSALEIANGTGVQKLALILAWVFGTLAIGLPATKIIGGSGEAAIAEFLNSVLIAGIFTLMMLGDNYRMLVMGFTSMFKDLMSSISSVDDFNKTISDT